MGNAPAQALLRLICRLFVRLPLYPGHKQIDNLFLLNVGKFFSFFNLIPFFKAVSAATAAGVLSLKYRMPLCRGLTSVVFREGGSKPISYKILGVAAYGIAALLLDIPSVLIVEKKGTAKF